MLQGKKILLGITGSIAAYKAAILVRLLVKASVEVRVVMTESATKFISPLTLSTLSGKPVIIDWEKSGTWTNHVEAGLWADLMVIAPCTANTLAGMAGGFGHNLLLGCYLSAKCPVIIAPAMDLDMWRHPAVKNNLRLVQSYGNQIIPVGNGFLASGLEGDGRMAEPEEILDNIHHFFAKNLDLKNKNVLITAGPTFEAIDPVRFIGNHSSGKMGIELAKSCANRGANVTLILGPTSLTLENPSIKVERIQSAQEMYDAVNQCFEQSDIVIFAAAVADYRPATVSHIKIKKKDDDLSIPLVKTIDIAATIGAKKSDKQILVGFALETNDEIINANSKLHKKNLDFIVLNSLADQGAGFKHDTNKVTIIDSEGTKIDFPLKSKKDVANDIIDYLVSKIKMDV